MKQKCKCAWCGAELLRYPSQISGRAMIFCSRQCLADYRSKEHNPNGRPITRHPHLSEYNRKHNGERMTEEVKEKLRIVHMNSGQGKTYTKYHGRHEHRVVAEKMLGRPLRKGEVVHHIDGDKRNNDPSNLWVFASQREHAMWHKLFGEGVVPNEARLAQLSAALRRNDHKKTKIRTVS